MDSGFVARDTLGVAHAFARGWGHVWSTLPITRFFDGRAEMTSVRYIEGVLSTLLGAPRRVEHGGPGAHRPLITEEGSVVCVMEAEGLGWIVDAQGNWAVVLGSCAASVPSALKPSGTLDFVPRLSVRFDGVTATLREHHAAASLSRAHLVSLSRTMLRVLPEDQVVSLLLERIRCAA